MLRKLDWTLRDLMVVLRNPSMPAAGLASMLHESQDEIEGVRQSIHIFHTGGKASMMSRNMTDYLSENRGPMSCAVCALPF
jgi:hypothetical protein